MSRAIFRGFGAVITSVTDKSNCTIAAAPNPDDPPPTSDQKLWIKLDFGLTPSTADKFSDAILDDRGIDADGNPTNPVLDPSQLEHSPVTSIGPLDELYLAGLTYGLVYLRDDVFDKLKADGKIELPAGMPWKPEDWKSYEITSVAYSADHEDADDPLAAKRQSQRYHGFFGKVKTASGSVAIIEIFRSTDDLNPVGTFGFDLDDPAQVDLPIAESDEPMIDLKADVREGGLWVNLRYAAALSLLGPKIPYGWDG